MKDVVWPESLEKITFTWCFNDPIDGVVWPEGVREIVFRRPYFTGLRGGFDQSIAGVVWTASLWKLTLEGLSSTHHRIHVAGIVAAADTRLLFQPADRPRGVAGVPLAAVIRL